MNGFSLDDLGRVSVEWAILGLRIGFVVALYLFILQVVRVIARETRLLATAAPARAAKPAAAAKPTPVAESAALIMVDPGESGIAPEAYLEVFMPTVVGRDAACHIVLDDPFVSTEHAEIGRDEDGWWVADLGSTNGTFVNGALLTTAATLADGDIVQFGRIRLRFAPANRPGRRRSS
jgi:hypothetical protein